GTLIAAELRPALEREVACVLTHVRVAPDDPAFDRPTKPIGPFYDETESERLQRERGWAMSADSNRGHRRVVPSPAPLEIVEVDALRRLDASAVFVLSRVDHDIPAVSRTHGLASRDAELESRTG